MIKELKDTVAMVCDRGTFFPVAQRLARDLKRVYYHMPNGDSFKTFAKGVLGDGHGDVRLAQDFWAVKPECDVFVFPDCADAGMQSELESQGLPVWGSKGAEALEYMRGQWMKTCEQVGLPMPPTHTIKGITNLTLFFNDHEGEVFFVKISQWRGDMETWKAVEKHQIRNKLDVLRMKFGPFQDEIVFYVQEQIDTDIESGADTYFVDSQWPNKIILGYEKKGECYDSQTEVLTDKGWLFFKDLDGSEKFLTLDISDTRHYRIEYQPATAYTAEAYDGEMCSIETQNISLLVTPNHKLLAQVSSQNPDAPQVEWTDFRGVKRAFRLGRKDRILIEANDPRLEKPFTMPWPKSAFYQGDGVRNIKFKFEEVSLCKQQFAAFLGIYLSEGWTNGKRINVAQSKYFDEMEAVLKLCGLRYSVQKNYGKRSGFEVFNKALARYLFQFGKAAQKHVPLWIKMSSREVIEIFLHYYCMGDGSWRPCQKSTRGKKLDRMGHLISTISKQMANDLQELYVKCGVGANVYNLEKRKIYRVRSRPVQSKNYIFPKQHIKWVDYSGMVYCVTVPNHIIMVRRNGKPIWCGNSYFATWKTQAEMPEKVWSVMEKITPVLAGHGYANTVSSEVRIKEEKSWWLDPCFRFPSPAGEEELELYGNFSEIVVAGAHGVMVQPDMAAEFCGEAVIGYTGDRDGWKSLVIPEEISQWVKLYACGYLDGACHFPPAQEPEAIGCVVALGDTPIEVIDKLKEYREALKDAPVDLHIEPIADLIKEIEKAEEADIPFTNQKMPEPAEVIE